MGSLSELIIVLFLFFFSLYFVVAVPAAPSPYCQLVGDVVDVNYNLFSDHLIHIRVQEVSFVKEDQLMSCEQLYPVGEIAVVSPAPKKMLFLVAQQVKGTVHFGGDERGSGTYFSDYEILSEIEMNIFQRIFYKFLYLIK